MMVVMTEARKELSMAEPLEYQKGEKMG